MTIVYRYSSQPARRSYVKGDRLHGVFEYAHVRWCQSVNFWWCRVGIVQQMQLQ